MKSFILVLAVLTTSLFGFFSLSTKSVFANPCDGNPPNFSSWASGQDCAPIYGYCGTVFCSSAPNCGGDEERVRGYNCNNGATCNGGTCIPNPPACSLTGPTVAYTNIPVTYTGAASIGAIGTLTGMGIDRNLPPSPTWTTLCASTSNTCTTNTTFPAVGTYYVNCNAYASYSNGTTQMGYVSKTVTVTTDTTAPTINSVTPSVASPANTNSVVFTANVTDAQSGLNTVQISINPDPNSGTTGTWTVLGTCTANGTISAYNCAQTWTPTTEGRHAVRVVALDRSGNSTTNSTTNALTYFLVDKTRPTVTSITTSPLSGTYSSQVQITGTVSDTVSGITSSGVKTIYVYVNSANGTPVATQWVRLSTCTNLTQCSGTWIAGYTGSSAGSTHAIAIDAYDAAGNQAVYTAINYTLGSSYICD